MPIVIYETDPDRDKPHGRVVAIDGPAEAVADNISHASGLGYRIISEEMPEYAVYVRLLREHGTDSEHLLHTRPAKNVPIKLYSGPRAVPIYGARKRAGVPVGEPLEPTDYYWGIDRPGNGCYDRAALLGCPRSTAGRTYEVKEAATGEHLLYEWHPKGHPWRHYDLDTAIAEGKVVVELLAGDA